MHNNNQINKYLEGIERAEKWLEEVRERKAQIAREAEAKKIENERLENQKLEREKEAERKKAERLENERLEVEAKKQYNKNIGKIKKFL